MHLLSILGLAAFSAAIPLEFDREPSLTKRTTINIAELRRVQGRGRTSSAALHSKYLQYGQSNILEGLEGSDFLTNVSFGSQTFEAVIDTGSSDTWLVETDFTCVNYTNNATVPEADCFFGPPYSPDSSFVQIPNKNFNISYADGEYINGIVGYDQVTFAEIIVSRQGVALGQLAGWSGDGVSSGLVGLAFPALTSSYPGTNASADEEFNTVSNVSNRITYSSIINTIFFVEKLTAPIFALALSRDESATSFGGIIAIGGVPDIRNPVINASSRYTSAPIEILNPQFIDPNIPEYQFYTITVEGLVYESGHAFGFDAKPVQYIVDSGTTLMYVPSADASAFNALFNPPSQLIDGIYIVECNATTPGLGVAIGYEILPLNTLDLNLDLGLGGGLCVSGIQDGASGPYILGDVFLRNVLALYDLGEYQMHFSSREYYQS